MRKKEAKSDWYLTHGTVGDHIDKVVEIIRTERLPNCIDEVIVFGSFIKGKLHPHDVDFLLVINEPEPEDYREATEIFHKLIEYTREIYRDNLYWTWTITKRLIRRRMKGVDLNYNYDNLSGDALLMFIRSLKDKKKSFESGFPMKVVWSSSWDRKSPRDKEHPLLPYLRYMQMINNAGIYGSMKKIDERIKALSTYDGGDWKALLNKEEKRCYDDTIYGQTEHDELERERRLLERDIRLLKQKNYELDRKEKEWKESQRHLKELDIYE